MTLLETWPVRTMRFFRASTWAKERTLMEFSRLITASLCTQTRSRHSPDSAAASLEMGYLHLTAAWDCRVFAHAPLTLNRPRLPVDMDLGMNICDYVPWRWTSQKAREPLTCINLLWMAGTQNAVAIISAKGRNLTACKT